MRLEPPRILPQLSESTLENLPPEFAKYAQEMDRVLHEHAKANLRDKREIDAPPVFVGALGGIQSVTANVLTAVHLTSSIDTHGWWDSSAYTYTPKYPGFFRCAWALNGRDEGGVGDSTYCYAQLNAGSVSYQSIAYGTGGTGKDAFTFGSAIVECNGSTDAIQLKGLMSTGTTTFYYFSTANRTWLTIDYLGRRLVK